MNSFPLEIKTSIQIQQPANVVFEAIVQPEKMVNYFIAKSTGPMEEGAKLIWQFPEFDTEFTILVKEIIQDEMISFVWKNEQGDDMLVAIFLESQKDNSTKVICTEKGMENTEAGLKWLRGNTEGWANFSACLKAYLEYGINLRKSAFDFYKK